MYDANQIKSSLLGLVGWRNNVDPSAWQLNSLTASSSGLWFNGAHPLVTIDNVISAAPEFDKIFSTAAEVNSKFTTWLTEKTEDAILKAVDDWYSQKFEKGTAANLLERDTLFSSTGNFEDTENSTGKNVGLAINPTKERSLVMTVEKIGVQFTENQTVTVKLFKSGKRSHEQTVDINYIGNGDVQWVDVNWKLKGEGGYWIAYDQRSISGKAINGVRHYSANSNGLTTFPSGRYFSSTAFNAAADNLSALWDLSLNTYTVSTNYGINLKMSVKCDYTDFIIEQKDLFKTVVQLQVAMDMLRLFAMNPDALVNRNIANISRAQILFEIDGDTQGKSDFSLFGRYKKALNTIQFDTSGIEQKCLPCRRRGIRYRAIGPG